MTEMRSGSIRIGSKTLDGTTVTAAAAVDGKRRRTAADAQRIWGDVSFHRCRSMRPARRPTSKRFARLESLATLPCVRGANYSVA